VVIGFLTVSSRKAPETSDPFFEWASHFLLILTFLSFSLLLYAIWQAPPTEQGIASIASGIVLAGLASFPLFHPTFIYPIFRSVFIITPSELLVCILFFLIGMSFVFAQDFWAEVRTFFGTFLPEHPFYSGIIASMLLVAIVVLATMPPFLTSWVSRMQGFKTPILEAQFSSSRDSHYRPSSFWGNKSNNWPNELLLKDNIDGLKASFSELELFALDKSSDLTESMQQLNSHLKSIGFYDYLETLKDPSTRPHLTEMKRQTGCWAMRLYYGQDHCRTPKKWKKPTSPTKKVKNESPKRGQMEMLYEKNPIFYGTVAFLFQFSEDFKKAELVLEAGLEEMRKPGLHWNAAEAYLNYWLGYLIYNRYHELQIEEADNRALSLFREAIKHATIVTEEISAKAVISKISHEMSQERIDDWKLLALQAKNSYILVAADSLLSEYSVRRYANDIQDAPSNYLISYPLLLESVGWAKIRFHKDEKEIREGKAILVELEKVVEEDETDKSLRWKVLKTIRSHISEADLLLGTG